jgi:2-iminobutanoate/2-iminopropanoate deaminase
VEIDGGERMVVISGQVGMTPDGYVPHDPIAQLGVVFDNIERNLEAADMGLGDLVKLTIYLVGEWDTDARRQVVSERLGMHRPTTTAVFVAGLAGPTMRVEIEAWASRAV